MEKKDIKINYSKSGVKTLDGFGTLFIVIGFISVIVSLVNFGIYSEYAGYSYATERATMGLTLGASSLAIAFGSFLGGAICKGLSGIARSSLHQRAVLEQDYYFIGD